MALATTNMSMMHLTGLLLLVLLGVSDAHFPRPCAEPAVVKSKRCCPEYKGSECGVALGRGYCGSEISTVGGLFPKFWPPPIYELYCMCMGNFGSYDCSRCKPGYKGENCTERLHHVRKEITTLSVDEKTRLGNALHMAKHKNSERYVILTRDFNDPMVQFENASVYDMFVWMHYYAGKAPADGATNAAHRGPSFPFWHRNYLIFMEREIRELTGDESFYIPYWNWVNASHCNICTNELMGESNEDGSISNSSALSQWKTVCTYDDEFSEDQGYRRICVKNQDGFPPKPIQRFSGFANNCTGLPTAAEVEAALSPDNYDTFPYDRTANNSFRNRLEGFDLSVNEKPNCAAMHNLVHDFFGGTLSKVPIAANDPMFMLHHAMIDKLFEEWLDKHRDMQYPVSDTIPIIQRGDSYMRPFFPPVRNDYLVGRTAEDLGYSYE